MYSGEAMESGFAEDYCQMQYESQTEGSDDADATQAEISNSEGIPEGNKTKLIVNYLPQNLTDEEFHELFSALGNVQSAKVIRDKSTNYSYGFGFVEFHSQDEAQAAIDALNGQALQHKTLKVAFAKPPGESTKNGNLYVQGIPQTMSNEALQQVFAPYGEIVSAKVLLKADLTPKGDGFVLFAKQEQAQKAIDDLDGQMLPGGVRPMSVKFAMENKKAKPGAKYPPPPPPGGRGGRGGNFGGPMRNRGGQQQNRFNPMQQQRGGGRGSGGGFRGGRGGWRGGANNGSSGFGSDSYGAGYDQGFGAEYSQGYDESAFGQGYDETGFGQGYDQAYEGFGAGDESYYDSAQQSQDYQSYPENGYQGYYDAVGFQGYQMPGQNNGTFGGGRGGRGAGGGGGRGGRGGRGAPRGAGGAGRGRGGGAGPVGKPTVAPGGGIALYVYNIGPSASEEDVMTIFSHYGSVTKVDVIMDYEKNVTKNYAFVHMATQEEAETAISALNERYCMRPNHPMQVRYHQPKGKGGK